MLACLLHQDKESSLYGGAHRESLGRCYTGPATLALPFRKSFLVPILRRPGRPSETRGGGSGRAWTTI